MKLLATRKHLKLAFSFETILEKAELQGPT